MKIVKRLLVLVFAIGIITTGCRKFLDVNADPSTPQKPDLAALMNPVTAIMSKMMGLDDVAVGYLIQNWSRSTASSYTYDIHEGNGTTTQNSYRGFWAQQGPAINLIIEKGMNEERWDYVGAAYALRAWGFQMTTDYFGELPFKQAFDNTLYTFTYDTQEEIYRGIDSLCLLSLAYLNRTDGNVNQVSMARGDQVYNGDRSKWIKFVYGLRARRWQRLTNKPNYNPDSVIYFVDHSFESGADNFYIKHSATKNDDTNPLGPPRDNFSIPRQTKFIVQLLDGTTYTGAPSLAARDPRIRGMMTLSADTTTTNADMPQFNGGYRFLTSAVADPISNTRQKVTTFYGDSTVVNPAIGTFGSTFGKFLFRGSANYPIMTYHELQFIKAEAAFRKGNFQMALDAYKNGISAHFDFVDLLNTASSPAVPLNGVAVRNAFLLNSLVVKQTAASLTLTDIMLQKYIGDWGWNLVESWSDMRRYHYFDFDPLTGTQVYKNYTITAYSSLNGGPRPQYRFKPPTVSENDWNLDELRKIGALNTDYHTYEMWFSKP